MRYINDNQKLSVYTGYLVAVRHGQSMGNAWNAAYRNPEMNFLTEYGETQAKLAGLRLKQTGIKFDLMITSSIVRARHTLSILAHTIGDWQRDFVIDERFNERVAADVTKGPLDRESSLEEHYGRVEAGVNELVRPILEQGKNVLLVSHYYTMQALFEIIGVNPSLLWGGGDHIPNAVPYIWDPNMPTRMLVLNDETRVPKY